MWTELIWLKMSIQWWVSVKAVMNLGAPKRAKNFLTSGMTIRFSRRTLLHRVT